MSPPIVPLQGVAGILSSMAPCLRLSACLLALANHTREAQTPTSAPRFRAGRGGYPVIHGAVPAPLRLPGLPAVQGLPLCRPRVHRSVSLLLSILFPWFSLVFL